MVSAMARPILAVAPVTITVLLANPKFMAVLFFGIFEFIEESF